MERIFNTLAGNPPALVIAIALMAGVVVGMGILREIRLRREHRLHIFLLRRDALQAKVELLRMKAEAERRRQGAL